MDVPNDPPAMKYVLEPIQRLHSDSRRTYTKAADGDTVQNIRTLGMKMANVEYASHQVVFDP